MDTGTHIVMGIALGGLALADPVVASHSITTTAVIAGTIIGSQAPDIDTVLKLEIMLFTLDIIVELHIPFLLSYYGRS